jgi:intracellular sulfur oxidation DsrE/DsrF family protein
MPADLSDRLRVVVHVDEASADRQHLALGNVANLLDDAASAGAEIEIVFNGPAISVVSTESRLAGDLSALRARGVGLLACRNSMVSAGLSSEGLMDGVSVIPSGIAHLVRRQHDGWAYVRP